MAAKKTAAKTAMKQAPAKTGESKRQGAGKIPPCPPSNPRLGDKTPEVVAWWFKYNPKEAEERYQGRKFQRPGQEPLSVDETGPDEVQEGGDQ